MTYAEEQMKKLAQSVEVQISCIIFQVCVKLTAHQMGT
jgi:hypothetical protein